MRRTTLRNGGAEVQLVEHVLAALGGLEIDNVEIELDDCEVPELDGSAAPFVKELVDAGIVEQKAPKPTFRIPELISISRGDVALVATPRDGGLTITYTLDYPDSSLGRQSYAFELTPDTFVREIASSRTFILQREVESLKRAGFGRGATYENTLVVGEDGVIENELRFPNEFVRHKILDLIGDLTLTGVGLAGAIVAVKSGHEMNIQLVRRLAAKAGLRRTEGSGGPLDVREIQNIIPHRYPMLLVDRVLEVEGSRRIVGVKNLSANEHFFQGHFPGRPLMPGVLQIEAMAQLAGVLLLRKLENTGKTAVLVAVDDARLRRPVAPGDQLVMEVTAERVRPRVAVVTGLARVAGKLVAEATLKFMLVDDPDLRL
jgi:UDP-3-O-[3-hydroxymyristoyl] N-acetylglucosamine deacetylase/3-hydroxyacyl-[acyl-carrier-protein] dehydratase